MVSRVQGDGFWHVFPAGHVGSTVRSTPRRPGLVDLAGRTLSETATFPAIVIYHTTVVKRDVLSGIG